MKTNVEPIADPVNVACERIGIGRNVFYQELAEGKISAVKARGKTLVTREEQARYIRSLPKVELPGRAA
jgi:predicted site-specific integrase-resolvase